MTLSNLTAAKDAKTMDEVIERLRASKQEHARADYNQGWECGVKWAKTGAEYPELKRAATAAEGIGKTVLGVNYEPISDDDDDDAYPAADLYRAVFQEEHCDNKDIDWFAEVAFGPDENPSANACRGFLAGAESVWDQVKDKI